MNVGQRVMLIAHWPECVVLPPLGTVGEIVEGLDADGDYYVLFPGHPCPVDHEPEWFCPPWALVRIDDPPAVLAERDELVHCE